MLLIKFDNYFHRFLLNTFTGRNGQFLALLAGFSVIHIGIIGRLALGSTISGIHVVFDDLVVLLNELDDSVFDGPFEKIQLSDGGLHIVFVVIGNGNAVPAAKGVEPLLGIRLELQFVVVVHLESTRFIQMIG